MIDDALLRDAVRANQVKRHARAVQLCTVGLNSRPSCEREVALRLERAEAAIATSDWGLAQRDCECVCQVAASPRALSLLARALLEQRRIADALRAAESAVAADPEPAGAWSLLAEVRSVGQQHEAAIAAAVEARSRAPGMHALKLHLRILTAAGKQSAAVTVVERDAPPALRDAEIWTILGFAHNALGGSDAAVPAFREALRLEPSHDGAHCGLGYALLRQGDYARGFVEHEHRQGNDGCVPRFGIRPWCGENLDGKHVIVWSEQGLGDVLQFARYMPLLRRLTERTTLHVPRTLVRLLRTSADLGPIVTGHPGFCGADYQTLLMSLPHLLRLENDVGDASVPYLVADAELVEQWRARLPSGHKIALCWQGNPAFAGEPWRSISLSRLAPILERHGERYHFISLQKNYGREQLGTCESAGAIMDLGAAVDSDGHAFVDSLAVLSHVDLLITTDTSLAHLAGAANVPTWLLLSSVCDWRWGIASDRTIWYPTMRLFRQPSDGDWEAVVERVVAALDEQWS